MKNSAINVVLLIVFALGAIVAQAQSTPILKADIPFDFTIQNLSFPSGTYVVKSIGNQVQLWQSPDRQKTLMVNTSPLDRLNKGGNYSLTFHRYGDEYFLWKIQSGAVVDEVNRGAREMRLAKAQRAESSTVAMEIQK